MIVRFSFVKNNLRIFILSSFLKTEYSLISFTKKFNSCNLFKLFKLFFLMISFLTVSMQSLKKFSKSDLTILDLKLSFIHFSTFAFRILISLFFCYSSFFIKIIKLFTTWISLDSFSCLKLFFTMHSTSFCIFMYFVWFKSSSVSL